MSYRVRGVLACWVSFLLISGWVPRVYSVVPYRLLRSPILLLINIKKNGSHMNSFNWGSGSAQDREASYRRELEELWQHAARVRAMKANRSGKSNKSVKSSKGGGVSEESEG